MSLKAFHIVFVALTTLTALAVAGWELRLFLDRGMAWHLVGAIAGLFTAVGLVVYGRYVLRKLKDISYL